MKLKIGVSLIVLASITSLSSARTDDMCRVPVPTAEGPVIGTAADAPGVCAYKGIPYAAPPVGDLRWQPPRPAPERSEAIEAVSFGSWCKQKSMLPGIIQGEKAGKSEDCLYLNVWRPKKEGTFPVMVWIHGGGLIFGSGSEIAYRGDRLVSQRDVVYVSFNYRLGVLSFLAHRGLAAEDPHGSSGNYGLLDQIAALKWVKHNIAAFGGDPDNITIFGESGGGRSVCYLLASPLAAGLFDRAIMQSGGCDTANKMKEGFAAGDEFAERLGCSGDKVIACLRSKSEDEVLAAMGSGFPEAEDLLDYAAPIDFPWSAPHEDGWALKETPIKSLKSGEYNQVPFMVGSTRDEAKLLPLMNGKYFYRLTRKSRVKTWVKEHFGELTPAFEKLYPYEKYHRAVDAVIDAASDARAGCNGFEAAEASSLHQPTYYYRFDYDDSRLPNYLGAAHALEIPFIFNALDRPYYKYLYSRRQRERARPLIDAMMSYWTNFAKTGNPNGEGLMEWPGYEVEKKQRMLLDLPQRVEPTDNVEKCEFWRSQRK